MKASPENLRAALRKAGLKATAPRVAVLAALAGSSSPKAHAEIAARLGGAGFDRATVYRNLMDLTEAGLARRIDLGDHVWRFEAIPEDAADHDGEHPHFVCRDCGVVECLPEGAVTLKIGRGANPALRQHGLTVQLQGVCDACQ